MLVTAVPAARAAEHTVVATADNSFFPRTLTLPPNTTVYFENRGLAHNVHFEDGLFEQPADPLPTPWRVWRHFDNVGVYRFYCEAHGGPGGQGMSGTIAIEANAAPTLTGLTVAPRRICRQRTRRCRKTTSTVRFQLSEDARVFGTIEPVGAPAGREGTEVDFKGRAGTNDFPIAGRLLAAGLYAVTLAAEDTDGNETDPATIRFRVRR